MKSLAFILFVIIIIGLFKPRLVLPFQKDKSRKKVLLYFGITLVIVVLMVGNLNNPDMGSTDEPYLSLSKEEKGKQIFLEIISLERQARVRSQSLYPVYGSELTEGSVFTLSKETQLMKGLNPKNGIDQLKDLELLNLGTAIEVLKSIDSPRSFRVKVINTGKEGFILRSALDAQTVADEDETLDKQMGLFYKLKEQADSAILLKHSFTQSQLDSLELVGIQQGWNN